MFRVATDVVSPVRLVAVPALPVTEPLIGLVKVLLSERIVEEAAVIVMFVEPSKATPLMVLVAANLVAVPALPLILPLMSEENVLLPEKVFASLNRVDDAAPASEVRK